MTAVREKAPQPPPKNKLAEAKKPLVARRYTYSLILIAVATVMLALYLLLLPPSKLTVGLLVMLIMIALMLLKVPIGLAMVGAGSLGLYVLVGSNAMAGTLREVVFNSFASWSLAVIPMFVLMGVGLGKSGIMNNAYESARRWLGWLPGGLAVSTNFAGAGMAATSGSTIGIVYAVGRVSIPEMIRSGYNPSLAMASTAMAGTLGQVIPPSVLLVIYAGVAQTPVGPQLLAGVIPGILLAIAFTVVIITWALVRPRDAPRGQSYSWTQRSQSLIYAIPLLILVFVVIGGIYSGIFTATESGAFGALIAMLLGVATVVLQSRQQRKSSGTSLKTGRTVGAYLTSTVIETVSAVSAIFVLLIGVNILTRVMSLSGVAQWVGKSVVDLGLTPITFLILLIPLYVFLGCFLDPLAMMLLTIPVFLGPLQELGVDPIWFGVFLVILAEIALVSPPIGILNFIILGVAQSATKDMKVKTSLAQVFRGVMPFIGACIVILGMMIAWPEIALWLPEVSSAN